MSGVVLNDAAFEAVLDRMRSRDRDRLNALNRGVALVNQTRRGTQIGDDEEGLWEVECAARSRLQRLREVMAHACAPWFEVTR